MHQQWINKYKNSDIKSEQSHLQTSFPCWENFTCWLSLLLNDFTHTRNFKAEEFLCLFPHLPARLGAGQRDWCDWECSFILIDINCCSWSCECWAPAGPWLGGETWPAGQTVLCQPCYTQNTVGAAYSRVRGGDWFTVWQIQVSNFPCDLVHKVLLWQDRDQLTTWRLGRESWRQRQNILCGPQHKTDHVAETHNWVSTVFVWLFLFILIPSLPA